jgi:hypothetical protein
MHGRNRWRVPVRGLAALLFRCQGGAWPVVVCRPLAVLILYLLVLYVVFGVGISELP